MASTRSYGGDGAPIAEQSIGELVATATRDMSALLHQEIALAKSELAEQVKRAAMGAGLLGGAGAAGLVGVFLLFFAGAYGVAAGGDLPVWAGFLIVGGFIAIVAGGLAMFGLVALRRVGGPEKTVSTVRASLDGLRHRRAAR